ncbi:hypothetical protein [Clostridium chrysemydis]|uniref:hypothetical protein n=1 Tax=Clostridium chrysemydis TaxID=2665504 RepID=UPI001883DC95|nr:hypothetical protein [Clostridium chrysemydis]
MTNKKIEQNKEIEKQAKEKCFVIMPISDNSDYETGHFQLVYEDVFKPAIEKAGFEAYRVDENKSSNVIHLEIIKALIDAPMAICDLSSKNPNVLYELGIRQAFDKPVVLLGDHNPGEIFDVGNINTYKYDKGLSYRNVIEDQKNISDRIIETYKNHKEGIDANSLIKILNIKSAADNMNNSETLDEKGMLTMMYSELISLKDSLNKQEKTKYENEHVKNKLLNDSELKIEFPKSSYGAQVIYPNDGYNVTVDYDNKETAKSEYINFASTGIRDYIIK